MHAIDPLIAMYYETTSELRWLENKPPRSLDYEQIVAAIETARRLRTSAVELLLLNAPENSDVVTSWLMAVAHASHDYMPEPPRTDTEFEKNKKPEPEEMLTWIATWATSCGAFAYEHDNFDVALEKAPEIIDRLDEHLRELDEYDEADIATTRMMLEHFRALHLKDISDAVALPGKEHAEEYGKEFVNEIKARRKAFFKELGEKYVPRNKAA